MPSLLTALLLKDAVVKYSPDQERDDNGRFAGAGFTAAGPYPKALAAAAGRAAVLGMGGSKTLAREAKQRAREAGAPKGESARAGGLARAAVRRELGVKYAQRPEGFKAREVKGGKAVDLKPPIEHVHELERVKANLEQGTITASKMRDPNAGNVNETHFMTFENGEKGVWKPKEPGDLNKGERGEDMDPNMRTNITPGMGSNREVGAYEVARHVGMTDLVPVTTFREHNGRTGSMQQFVPDADQAAKSGNPFDGRIDAARAAAFDFVIGNEDRHAGNWMLQGGSQIKLIDHGLSFPETSGLRSIRGFMANADTISLPGEPRDHAAAYISNRDAILGSLRGLSLPETAVKGVEVRINQLSKMKDWHDMTPEWNGKGRLGGHEREGRPAPAPRPAPVRGAGRSSIGERARRNEFARHVLDILQAGRK